MSDRTAVKLPEAQVMFLYCAQFCHVDSSQFILIAPKEIDYYVRREEDVDDTIDHK